MYKKRKYVKSGKFSKKNSALDAPIPYTTKCTSSFAAVGTHNSEDKNERQGSEDSWSCKM
jgi:hypothetical protein